MRSISATDFNGNEHSIRYDRKPDTCPLCHHSIDPFDHNVASIIGEEAAGPDALLELVFQCTRFSCHHLFIGRYRRFYSTKLSGTLFGLVGTAPFGFVKPVIQQDIAECSPMFKVIFCQAAEAEKAGLDQIAGVGYRKSLEFLIKDYCIHMNPAAADSIMAQPLASVIDKWVDDAKLNECVRRAAWLGNDETHYVRRWEDKELADLKLLIELSVYWVANSLLTSKYLAEMPDGRKRDFANADKSDA